MKVPFVLIASLLLLPATLMSAEFEWAAAVVPDGFGANIHFTHAKPGEMEMLAASGMRWIRMDFSWGATEREKGTYDFFAYDHLMNDLERHGIRALLILDYSNRHYDDGLAPHSDEGRQAFARWAAAAAKHFQGRGVLWEMYNEPNIGFWKPKPNVGDYTALALEVGKAIRREAPGEIYIGPATSQIDMKFLEDCFKAGLLEYWDAVSVHPYRQTAPETVIPEYQALRELIAKYAPAGKSIPIISGEWGYSAVWKNYDEQRQGKYLPRQWLTNLAEGIPVSIWYDWHDDGPDPNEPEHHFGMTAFPYHEGRDPVYDPKPAYLAAQALNHVLSGYRFVKRLEVAGEHAALCHVLLFEKDGRHALAAWTQADGQTARVTVEIPAGKYRGLDYLGKEATDIQASGAAVTLELYDTPTYFVGQP